MSRVDELPADQRAALSLLLRQHKTYAEVAGMLGIPERAVHDRAQAALAILAPREARELDGERRREIGDYLLGQQPGAGERLRTRTLLGASPEANAWARAVAGELAPLSDGATAEIPTGAPGATAGSAAAPEEPYPISQAAGTSGASTEGTAPRGAGSAATSRRGGAVLLAVLAAAVIVAVILILSGGSSGKKTGTTGTAASSKSGSGPKEEGRFPLHAPPGSASKGTVEILSEGGKRAFYIQAVRLPQTRGFFYAVWLYNSPTSAVPLSKAPPVGKSHRLAGAALLPSNAGNYREILLTRETNTRPKHPGHVVLRGAFKVNG